MASNEEMEWSHGYKIPSHTQTSTNNLYFPSFSIFVSIVLHLIHYDKPSFPFAYEYSYMKIIFYFDGDPFFLFFFLYPFLWTSLVDMGYEYVMKTILYSPMRNVVGMFNIVIHTHTYISCGLCLVLLFECFTVLVRVREMITSIFSTIELKICDR